MIRAGIFGVSGYAGHKLVEILLQHPEVAITYGAVAPEEGTPQVSEILPKVRKIIELRCANAPDWDLIEKTTDVIFLALPHIVSMKFVPELIKRGKKVIDLSADFRFRDLSTYETFYTAHTAPDLCEKAVYGLPELNRACIKTADLIGNPGCYPTSIALALLPLVKGGLIESHVIADSKSGVTGAGRVPSPATIFPECNENLKAYKIGEHRHAPEIAETLSIAGKNKFHVLFVPHLVPVNQGILSTVYATLKEKNDGKDIQALYEQFYAEEPFVRVMKYGNSPETKNVVNTNFCDVGIKLVGERQMVVVSALDNLIKGASGQAVQNFNIMYGFPETTPFYRKP